MGRWHAWAIEKTGGHVAVVVDPNPTAAARLAARHKGARAFTDVEKALRSERLDVLHLCAPSETHYRIAELAIDARLSVIVEKPLTPQAGETELLFDRAESNGVILCPVHQFLFQDGTLTAKAALPHVGRLAHLQGVFCSAGGAGKNGEQLDALAEEILPHPLSLLQTFLPGGLPEFGWKTSRPDRGEIRVSGQAGDASLSILVSMRSRPTVCSFQILGEHGTIHLDLFHGYAVIESGEVSRWRKVAHPFDLALRTLSAAAINLGRRIVQWQPAYPGLKRLVGEFYQAARDGTTAPISRGDAIAVARVRDILTRGDAFSEKAPARVRS
jgi:predicted dehydrogenase